ncbi:MAG: hypothetical protein JSS35_17040 [Proteobacteria bacterium]|nr:hypothetical protein [Pseudomonadota bacterium]
MSDPTRKPVPPAPLPVVFALHDAGGAYWLNTAVAMSSVLRHARQPLAIHILHDETLSEASRRRLREIAAEVGARERATLSFVPVGLPAGVDLAVVGKFSPASLYRLTIPRLFAEAELVVYLDSDIVANGVDISDLAAAAAPDAPVSAVMDPFVGRPESHRKNFERLGLDPDRYFNSGVLALRPPLIPSDLLAEFAGFARANPGVVHPDQDFLNSRFRGLVHALPERFNTLIGLEDRRLVQPLPFYANRVLHYAGGLKPLSGAVAPAFIPFFAHAIAAPEIYSGAAYHPDRYVFPYSERTDATRSKRIDADPGA